jgi:hypothetical protein
MNGHYHDLEGRNRTGTNSVNSALTAGPVRNTSHARAKGGRRGSKLRYPTFQKDFFVTSIDPDLVQDNDGEDWRVSHDHEEVLVGLLAEQTRQVSAIEMERGSSVPER